MTLRARWAAVLVFVAACGGAPPPRTFDAGALLREARTGEMGGTAGREGAAATRRGLEAKLLLDEARVTYVQHGSVCVAVVLRAAMEHDAPLEGRDVTLNGLRAYFDAEQVTVTDHATGKAPSVIVAEASAAALAGGEPLPPPGSNVLRVFERRASLCAKVAPPDAGPQLTLALEHTDPAQARWFQQFAW